jgi:hypothetical protein
MMTFTARLARLRFGTPEAASYLFFAVVIATTFLL